MALIYVPLERLWPQYPKQGTFRNEWTLDVVYFMSTHLPMQVLSFLVLLPATQAVKYLGIPVLQRAIGRLPWLLQFFLAVVVADVAEYFIHLAFHKVPFLWRFHAIHHSSKALDWIAGSRSHFVDDTLVRGFILVPLMFGFSQTIILAYLIFVTLHATWTHCNFGPSAKWIEKYLVMPRYHHWHHTSQKEGIDKNFAIHFPWIDKLFGTYYFTLMSGRNATVWTAKNFHRAFWARRLNHSREERGRPKNPARPVERPRVSLLLFSLPSPGQDIS